MSPLWRNGFALGQGPNCDFPSFVGPDFDGPRFYRNVSLTEAMPVAKVITEPDLSTFAKK